MYWQLAWQSLASARAVSITSALLVCVSVVSVVGAEQAFVRVTRLVETMVDGSRHTADVDISGCAVCARIRRESPYLVRLVDEVRHARTRIIEQTAMGARFREVPVRCLSSLGLPIGVRWTDRRAARSWRDAVGFPAVVLGADVAALSRRQTIRTRDGTWHIVGVARPRPTVSHDAGENSALLVPDRAPFTRLCAGARPTWRVSAYDSTALQQALHDVDGELRTRTRMRPTGETPWRIQRADRFAAVLHHLTVRLRVWLLVIPLAVAMLCGAGVFGVQTLQSEQRIAEFGVRRAVGASRRALLWQLVTEVITTGVAGVAAACLLLGLSGLFVDTPMGVLRGVLLALTVALPIAVAGQLVPGISALRTTSIAQLEGRGH